MERLRTPATARVGEEIEATVTITSTVAQPATVRLFGDGEQIGSQEVTLEAGSNTVVFRTKATEAGFHTFRALVEAGRDTFAQNDRADSNTIVKGDPRILVVAGDEEVAANLVAALQRERQDVTTVAPEAVPGSLTGPGRLRLGRPRRRAAHAPEPAADAGHASLHARPRARPGDDRRAASRTAPAATSRRRSRRRCRSRWTCATGRSSPTWRSWWSSTSPAPWTPATATWPTASWAWPSRACPRWTSARRPSCAPWPPSPRATSSASSPSTRTPTGPSAPRRWATSATSRARSPASRPTARRTSSPASRRPSPRSRSRRATRRHIVLLTDGWSRSGEYDDLLARMTAAGITLSTVGAGGGAADILRTLAERGGGRYYPAANPASIPDIFLKETQQVSGQQIVEESFFPIQTGSSPILRGPRGGPAAAPRLQRDDRQGGRRDGPRHRPRRPAPGPVAVRPGSVGGLDLRRDRSLGEVAGSAGRASTASSASSCAWTFPGEETGGIEAEFVTDGDETRLRVTSVESDGTPRDFYDTAVTDRRIPSSGQQVVVLDQVAPGVYESDAGARSSRAPTRCACSRSARAWPTSGGRSASSRRPRPSTACWAPTSACWRRCGRRPAGRPSRRPRRPGSTTCARPPSPPTSGRCCCVLALLLFPIDVAVRRVSIARRDLVAAREWAVMRLRGRAARPAAVGGMLAAKERAAGTRSRAALLRPTERATPSSPTRQTPRTPEPAPEAPPTPGAPPPAEPGTTATDTDTLARLREAKRRARR